MKILFWFRNNLRLQDNSVLNKALDDANEIAFIYIQNQTFDKDVQWGFPRVAAHRKYFQHQGLIELDHSLKKYGHRLNFFIGDPIDTLKKIYIDYDFDAIYAESIYAPEEEEEIDELKNNHLIIKTIWDSSLYFIEQLPFDIKEMPNTFSSFRKKIESALIKPNRPCSILEKIKIIRPVDIESVEIKTISLNDYSRSSFPIDRKEFSGGEITANNFVKNYFKTDLASNYKETRNQLSGIHFSTKFSPWLAQGFISARTIYDLLINYELNKKQNESTYWIFFELLWRDYFRFILIKFNALFFKKYGLKGREHDFYINHDEINFKNWTQGKTDNHFINAAMIELKETGFLSNRMRQIVASYLIYELDCDWRAGAAWFESQLIDYDVYSNQGNWAYIAGLGTDPRGGRIFNVDKQKNIYDPHDDYVARWSN